MLEGLDDTLTVLRLHDNDLVSLPPRIFETLTGLTALSLRGNPGSARFVPVARAGPEGGIEVVQGAAGVTLGVEDAAAGYDDPWGSNVTYSWSQTAGASQGAGNWTTARPSFTAPAADETLTFTLTVTGRGGRRATSTVYVRVGTAGVRPMPVRAAVNGVMLTLTYGEDLQETAPAPASGKGPVYLAVVSEQGVRRAIETVPVSGARASGRAVTITLEREVVHNRVVTLSYFPDNAVAAGRVRDRTGNLAGGFAGLRVRNVLSEGPAVRDIAFTGAANTYGIGNRVGIDVTFSEAVNVTASGGAPTLALEIGSASRKARWKAGQGPGAVQRFDYTVAEGDEDADGIAVETDGLAVPSGSSILTTAASETVNLRHGRFHDPAHRVDGVRPAVPPSQTIPGGTVAQRGQTVPPEWALLPSGKRRGDSFRLLFVTSTGRNATSSNIGDYNRFVQDRAAAGHTAIRSFSGHFRALASTRAAASTVTVNAIDNTGTTHRGSNKGPPIYWLNGGKVANDYADFYDGSWSNQTSPTREDGSAGLASRAIWTGSRNDGFAASKSVDGFVLHLELGASTANLQAGRLDFGGGPLGGSEVARTSANPLFGLSPVLTVDNAARTTAASVSSSPSRGSTYRAGETVTVRLAMSEAVLVTGRPSIVLEVGGDRRRAAYSGPVGSATDVLEFSYTVQAGDFDTDGVALCRRGAGCGRITLDGGSIRAFFDRSAARLGHPALVAQSGHKVDAAAALPVPLTACSSEIRVPDDWALKPSGVSVGGKFRLLFVTSRQFIDAVSPTFAENNRFVQDLAAAGHSAIRPFKGGFRLVGSSLRVHARDNTCTTGTGVEIHWLNGNKVADDYADFYDDGWDDQTNPKSEHGNAVSARFVWTGSESDGTIHSNGHTFESGELPGAGYIGKAGFSPLCHSYQPLQTGTRNPVYGLSQVFKVPLASEKARTTDIAIVSTPAIGDAYRLGETVEVEVTYSEAVSVRGTPHIGLSVKNAVERYDNEYDAAYVRGSGTTKLVFAFTVPSGLKDDDGIQLYSSPLRLNGAGIAAVSDGDPAVWTLAAWRNIGGKVNTARTLTGGVCGRTPQVRYAIVGAVAAASDCSQVTEAHLARISGEFEVSGLTSLAAGDLAGLSGLGHLRLYGSGIETLPVGLFDGLDSLTALDVRAGLTHLPMDIFRGLGKVAFLSLDGLKYPESPGNQLRVGGLPDGIFEPLSRDVKEFWIFGSPGSDSFRPRAADAGPGGTLSAGQTVMLGGPGNDGGPWGSNVFYRWQQKDGSGNAVSTVALPVTAEENVVANPSFTVPTLAETTEVRFQLRLDGAGKKLDGSAHGDSRLRLGLYSPVSEARYTILAPAPTGLAVVSRPVDRGDTYKGGERIEVAVTFGDRVLVDTSMVTPTLGLTVGTQTRLASYVGGTGTNRLVFEYTVQPADTDGDGIAVAANGLTLNGAAIANIYGVAALLDHAALAAQTGHKVDGSDDALSGGICERSPQLRDKLVDLVKANDSNVSNCSQVTTTHLAALPGVLDLRNAGIATLRQGDFAHLGGTGNLRLQGNDLTALPAGVFEGLDDTLTRFSLFDNDLQTMAPGVFDTLTGLSHLSLDKNDIVSLPPRIFEKLTGLVHLDLRSNPGSTRFVPTVKAGPAGGIEVVSGGSVTLGAEGAENGYDDPWGSNVTWSWTRTGGAGGSLTDAAAARAAFTAPATGEDGTHVFRLKVVGAADFAATADVAVRVAAGPKAVEAAFAPAPASGGGPAYTEGSIVTVALHFDRAVTVDIAGGTPSVALTVGAGSRPAGYLRGSGTRVLSFGYTVQAADLDADGVDLAANSLALNGGRIVGVTDGGAATLGHAALAGGSGRTVNSAWTPPAAGGICDRTAAVQSAILERVRAAENDDSLQCGDITAVRLLAIGGRLDLSAQASNGRMTALRVGDFAWLANMTVLDLDNHALRSFPAGIFDPLTSLSELSIAYNQTQAADRMTALPAGLFDRLTKLTALRLEHNDLESLPDGIFGKLTRLTTLTLDGNPGSATFLPVAVAGPTGGIEAETGERVTLGGDAGGPWGSNVVQAWRQVSGTAVALSATDAAKPAFAAPALAAPENLAFELTVTGRGTNLTATDRVSVRIAGAAAVVSSVVPASAPIDGDTYRRGETIGIAVGFAKPVTVTGTPQLALSVGTQTRQAAYVRGSGTEQLVFEYTVQAGDADSDGIAIAADSLALAGGGITAANGMAALLGHPALAALAGHRVDGSLSHAFDPTDGICGRTAPVRDGLLLAVQARTGDTGLDCSQVTEAHLGALSETLILAHKGIGTLKPGDFSNLGGIAALQLDNNDLTALPAGVFEGLDDTLTVLRLHDNDLVSLPPRIFETLTGLTTLSLRGNPGSARFVPVARAGPKGGIEAVQGAAGVTLGVEDAAAGYDDPWGSNVTYSWSQTAGASQGAGNWTTARPSFTAPAADETLTFTLTVTGRGGHRATSTVYVRVGAAGVGPMPVSATANGVTLTLTYGEDLQETAPAPASGKGPVYLAVVSEQGVRRAIETARPSAVEVKGRQVKLTLDRLVEYNEVVTLSYFPDNAVAADRVRDRVGNLAGGFAGLRVRNETPDAPSVQGIAFAGAAKTYGIGDTVGIDVTFSEAVNVTASGGAPTLALEVGAAERKAAYVRGSGSAVLTFDYTVAEGDADTDGIAVEAHGLAVPSGSSILTTAKREEVMPGHRRAHDPAHKVDGVRPTPAPDLTVSEGPGVSVIWIEPLDAGAVPAGAGGFTVDVPGAANPVVTAVTISGSVVNLALNASIALGTTGVTVDYTPTPTPIRDAAGNAAVAFTNPLAVTVAVDETPPALTAAAVNGDTLTLTYSEPLKATGPEAAAYTAGVTGGGTLQRAAQGHRPRRPTQQGSRAAARSR